MRRNNGLRPVWKLILTDLLIAVLILAGWWLSRVISLELTARRFEKNSAAVLETVPAESSAPVSTVPDDNGSPENETADPPEPTVVVEVS